MVMVLSTGPGYRPAAPHEPPVFDFGVHAAEFLGHAKGQAAPELPLGIGLFDQHLVPHEVVGVGV